MSHQTINRLRSQMVLIIGATLAVSAVSLLLPQPPGAELDQYYNPWGTAIVLVDVGLGMGTAYLLWQARRVFKSVLWPAYLLLAIAAFSTAIWNLSYPLAEYYGLWENPYVDAATYMPYFFGGIFMYLAARCLFRLAGLKHWAASWLLMTALTVGLWLVYTQTPHDPNTWPTETVHDLMQFITLTPVLGYAIAAYLVARVRGRFGEEYQGPFGWLAAGLAMLTFTAGLIVGMEIVGYDNILWDARLYEIPIILADLLLLTAAYRLNQIGLPPAHWGSWWTRILEGRPQPVTSTDIVVYVAGLATDRAVMTPHVNRLRSITARMHTEKSALTGQERDVLVQMYLDIERYLVGADQLRPFTKASLRAAVRQRFADSPGFSDTFWPLVEASSTVAKPADAVE